MSAHQASQIESAQQSLFFQRLKSLSSDQLNKTALGNLCTATLRLMENAQAISKQIARFLPQFTLHDGVHLWNVLSFMEELAGGADAIQKLEAGDCAMAIWAAFTHDLGMVLEASELSILDAADDYDSMPAPGTTSGSPAKSTMTDERAQSWRAYRDGHEHWSAIRKDRDLPVNRMRLGIIRAAYIRDSHAREDARTGHCRIADWLRFLADNDRLLAQAFDDFAVADRIVRVAVSHNQDIHWLPRQLDQLGAHNPSAEFMGSVLGTIHWTWIGWLLRLADVFDCDKSRTPKILFDHGGITDFRSKTEWQKHLALPSPPMWMAETDHQTLLYTCQRSPSPVVEKAIHQIITWMNEEIDKVRSAWLVTPDQAKLPVLKLPSQAVVQIKHREGGYLYHDMEFRLDRDAVVELLMGESLYGGPELALRELVQNALDAVHLRDQRNQLAVALKKAGGKEKPRQPHEPWDGVEPGVEVTWGFDTAKQRNFIRVADNGVGMTVGTMRRFLTQIGKSYYKSDDFRAEQELMRRNGILCTAISQFGIGFLSVFMLADEVTIHTRPVGVTSDRAPSDESMQETARFPFRAEIHGPHGLLAFYPDETVRLPGTTVTIWHKDRFVLANWDREALIAQSRKEFYEIAIPEAIAERLKQDREAVDANHLILDPGFEISRFIVWPLYPVKVESQSMPDPLVIDDSFHFRELVPLDRSALRAKAEEWGCSIPEIEKTDWCKCDWIDAHQATNGIEGTGSRIRLVAAQPEDKSKHYTPAEWSAFSEYLPSGHARLMLSSFTEPHLPEPVTRFQCLVNGVRIVPGFVPSKSERDCHLSRVIESIPIVPGQGGWVWIDLRGDAMPRLRADRSAPVTIRMGTVDWQSLWKRWTQSWPALETHWLPATFLSRSLWTFKLKSERHSHRLGLKSVSPHLVGAIHLADLSIIANVLSQLPGDHRSQLVGSKGSDFARDLSFDHALALALARALDHDRALDLNLAQALARDRTRAHDYALALDLDRIQRRNLSWGSQSRLISELVHSHLASEALGSDTSDVNPVLGLATSSLVIERDFLEGPLHVKAGASIERIQPWLSHFDLVVPYTAIPTNSLRRKFGKWISHRGYRALYMLPFLFGEEPHKDWRSKLERERPFDSLMLFLPNPDHWEWLFAEHSREEWAQGSASAFWDLKTGDVLYADGIHDEASIRREGKPLKKWLGIK
jgi:hypothetical protein